jgi:hypothetical protein
MSNLLANWWRSRQFRAALKNGNTKLAEQLLYQILKSGSRLSWLEKLFKDKLKFERSQRELQREVAGLRRQLSDSNQESDAESNQTQALEQSLKQQQQEIIFLQNRLEELSRQTDPLLLTINREFIDSVIAKFKVEKKDTNLIQCLGIDPEIFYELEINLVKYLESEFERYAPKENLIRDLRTTYERDIRALKSGKDPQYDSYLTPHVYFMVYFLEGVYSAYLAWFLVYRFGLLPTKVNILDIGAGSGAMLYGLFSLLKSASNFALLPQTHISYCSLELQGLLQHHGFEFWKQFIEPKTTAAFNTYCRFKTENLFNYGSNGNEGRELPHKFFNFISISHCIFADQEQRVKSHQIYRKIFSESLADDGYVLIVVQGRRLFQAYGRPQTENQTQEENLIENFVEELGLKLDIYKYLASTGQRTHISGFRKFAEEKIPPKLYMSKLMRQYLNFNYDAHYLLDDYVILAKK